MDWLVQLVTQPSIAQTILVLSAVIASGLAVGHVKVAGISLGIAGVLFAGLAFGHFHLDLHPEVLDFAREFGLILFVYTIGIQVGPGFFASFRRQGIGLNATAAAVVLLGVATMVTLHFATAIALPVLVGLMSGAVTNTPSLAAAQQALPHDAGVLAGMGYAVAYPFGILGIILTMLLVRWIFRIDPQQEAAVYQRDLVAAARLPATLNLAVKNPGLVGQPVKMLSDLVQSHVVISRLWRRGETQVPQPDTLLELGDVLLAVATQDNLEKLRVAAGDVSPMDLRTVATNLTTMRILVTQRGVLGQPAGSLDLYGAAITRVYRAGVEFVATPNVRLQFGDTVTVVGEDAAIKKVAADLGNSPKQLNYPNILPIFVGIILGVVAGSIPLVLPGVPAPVKLGLAGGPLLVAILLSRLGNVGPVTWYLPQNANLIVREIGIALFLACVGLKSGGRFLETVAQGDGLVWLLGGALITFVPLFLVALCARWFFQMNYVVLCGLLAGSMTDPPALSFANTLTQSDGPAVTYATVYPLTMFLRVVAAQALVLIFAS